MCRVLKSSCSLQQGGQGAALSAALADVMCSWAAWVQSKASKPSKAAHSASVSVLSPLVQGLGSVGLSPMALAFVEGNVDHAKVLL